MRIPEAARKRYDALTDESKGQFLCRYRRLRREFKTPENASLLAAGLLPADIKKWPPKLRYKLASAMALYDLTPGTGAWRKMEKKEISKIASWLNGWWERTHEWK